MLEYIKDVPFGVNDNIFEELFNLEKATQLFKLGSPEQRCETIIHLLTLNGQKIYHHNIKEFKKILGFVKSDNIDAIVFLTNYQVENRQGCYQAIEYILSYKFNGRELYENFVCQKDIIIWMDNAVGREPQKPWLDKLKEIEEKGLSKDVSVICQWMLSHNELKYDEKDNWVDSIFSRFQKSSRWYLNIKKL